ncbi:hypothetical protein CY35_01G174800 [Sphagnum magellanicum]|nr:hypothetical protein CY35_01G174800 [Sphagnum magellanicum]
MRKLYGDVLSCGYEDVHVMWSMLHHHQTYPLDSSPKREAFPGIMHLHREAVWHLLSALESGELASHQTSYCRVTGKSLL